MQRKIHFIILLSMLAACKDHESEQTAIAAAPAPRHIAAFSDTWQSRSIKDIQLISRNDTINYALGIAWAGNMARIGLKGIAPCFYLGVFDQFVQNNTFVMTEAAGARLNKALLGDKHQQFAKMDEQQVLGKIQLQTGSDTLSYELGYLWATSAKKYGIENVTPAVLLGLVRGFQGDTSLFTYAAADKYLRRFIEQKRVVLNAGAKYENEQWLRNNATMPGIQQLESGLQYKIIKKGSGKPMTEQDIVSCNYTARLINNTIFESSEAGVPLRLYLRSVIKGWQEALLHMREGDRWELYIPYHLGYGYDGIAGKVPPFATLIYDVEVVRVEERN